MPYSSAETRRLTLELLTNPEELIYFDGLCYEHGPNMLETRERLVDILKRLLERRQRVDFSNKAHTQDHLRNFNYNDKILQRMVEAIDNKCESQRIVHANLVNVLQYQIYHLRKRLRCERRSNIPVSAPHLQRLMTTTDIVEKKDIVELELDCDRFDYSCMEQRMRQIEGRVNSDFAETSFAHLIASTSLFQQRRRGLISPMAGPEAQSAHDMIMNELQTFPTDLRAETAHVVEGPKLQGTRSDEAGTMMNRSEIHNLTQDNLQAADAGFNHPQLPSHFHQCQGNKLILKRLPTDM